MSTVGNSTNISWNEFPVGKLERQKLLNQQGCVVWITGLSGSGKSTLACSLGRELHSRGKLSYILEGDNLRHGLNKNLGFTPEDRTKNIRRVGEVAKLFSDAGLICIASLISPYRKDHDACRAMLTDVEFIEVFMNMPLEVCEGRDPKGLYKLARPGKIKGSKISRASRASVVTVRGDENDVEELEMLLETYFMQIDGTFNKLTTTLVCAGDDKTDRDISIPPWSMMICLGNLSDAQTLSYLAE